MALEQGAKLLSGMGAFATAANPYLSMAQLGIGVLTSIAGTSEERKAGERKMGYIKNQQSLLAGQDKDIAEMAGLKRNLALDTYGSSVDKASWGVGSSLFNLTRTGMSGASNIGFARSGALDTQIERGQSSAITEFDFQREGLKDVLGQKLMDISSWEGGEMGRLKEKSAQLSYEYDTAQAQANKKFLGIFG